MDKEQSKQVLEQIYDADTLAKAVVDHITNDKGEILARVWENQGFQEVYDYKGVEKRKRRLLRKQEQVFNQLDATHKLFQKCYYNPALTLQDELTLREAFLKYNQHHDTTTKVIQISSFAAYWPITYVLSRSVRPSGILAFSLFYLGFYKFGLQRFCDRSLQANLNRAAIPIAEKYDIKKPDDYLNQQS